ncbi:MAG: hypothetical protein AAFR16_00730 [Pseudomonadota bacterium]
MTSKRREIVTEFDAATAPWERGVKRIEGRLRGFERTTTRRLDSIDGRLARVGRGFATMGRSVAGAGRALRGTAIAATAATAGFTALVARAFAYAEAVQDAANKTGVSVEALQELQFAADQNGASARDMTDALTRLQRRMGLFINQGAGPARVGVQALGLETEIAAGKLDNTEDAFNRVVAALQQLGSQAEISAVASAFFGDDAGPRLAALLARGSAGIARWRAEARKVGAVMSTELVAKGAEVNAQFRAMARGLDTQVKTALVSLGPEINALGKELTDILPAIVNFTRGVVGVIRSIGDVAAAVGDAWNTVAEGVEAGISAFDGGRLAGLREFAAAREGATSSAAAALGGSMVGGGLLATGVGPDAAAPASAAGALGRIDVERFRSEVAAAGVGAAAAAGGLAGGVGSPARREAIEAEGDALLDVVDIYADARVILEETRSVEERLRIEMERLAAEYPRLVELIEQEAAARGEVISRADAEAEAKRRIGVATERLTEQTAALESAGAGAFQNLSRSIVDTIRNAESFDQALVSILNRLADMALDQAFNAIFSGGGSSSGGGFLGGIFRGVGSIFGFADGGFVSGPGGPREDRIVARLSAGEFVVNARDAARNRSLLEAINNGMPAFRDGGLVAPAAPPVSAGGGGSSVMINTPISVTVEGGAGDGDDTGRRVGEAVKRAVQAQLLDQLRPGGLLDGAIKRQTGRSVR